jgi:hypothetical protein
MDRSQGLKSLLRLALVAVPPIALIFFRHRRLDNHSTSTGTLSSLEARTNGPTTAERTDGQGVSVAGFEQALVDSPRKVLSLALIHMLGLRRPRRSSLPLALPHCS